MVRGRGGAASAGAQCVGIPAAAGRFSSSSSARRSIERASVQARLEFEVTESVFADQEALATLHKLAALGVHLSLDDFGTGYSSLGYLRAHPVQSIKIDRSFIEEVATNLTAATLAETMITMAHALGKRVVAEGVETLKQLEFLRSGSATTRRDFYLARPAAAEEITALLERLQGASSLSCAPRPDSKAI